MSLYQFAACIEGWNDAHGSGAEASAPTAEEFLQAKNLHGDG